MSNSPLVCYTKISPNKTKRTDAIRKITIHHMAGCISIESCGSWFAQTAAQCSSNYGIGSDGRIALYVPEDYRSWCSSSRANDNQAVTIEIANSATGGNWPVSDKALAACIDLCVDICQRNGIKALNYTGDTSGNLTRHDMFANKVCPGPYLGGKFPYIVAEVNKRLGNSDYRPTLRQGDSNDYVTELQEALVKLGYELGGYKARGYFGAATLADVKSFQEARGLEVDGVVGPITWAALLEALEEQPEETAPADDSFLVQITAVTPVFAAVPAMELKDGVYTIVETAGGYGRLKSGAGWIPLDKVANM